MATLLRLLAGAISLVLFFLGRGARIQGQQLSDLAEYYFGVACQITSGALALLVFVILVRTRVKGPAATRAGTGPIAIGRLFLAVSAVLLLSSASILIVATGDSSVLARMMRGLLTTTPDVVIKALAALLAAAAGASALRGSPQSVALVRVAAVPLVLMWPLGALLAIWGAWATLGPKWQRRIASAD